MDNSTSRFDTTVAVSIAVVVGGVAFFLVGMEVLLYSLWIVPVLGPVLLGVGALGGGWLVARGRPSAKGLGAGMVVGWVLLAFWSSGWSLGFFG